jgi:predicted HicB family RNase H-like nuclease
MKQPQKFYAKRLAEPHTRRCQLGFRVSKSAKALLQQLANTKHMSIGEYLARLLNDHLAQMTRSTP